MRARVQFQSLLGLLAACALPLRAVDLASVCVGDTADADIVTPVALDVVDATATAVLQADRARQIPAVFRSFPAATNGMTRAFLAAFAQAHTNFLADLMDEFHAATLDDKAIASADFGPLVTGFGVKHREFPIPDELAAQWARGGDGQVIRDRLLAALQQAAARRVGPDALPDGMIVGDTIRLVMVTAPEQKLSPDTVLQSPLVPAASLTPVVTAQAQFRRGFPAGQQLFARALAAFLQPNCLPDAPFTQLTRGTAVGQMIVASHYEAGDFLVHRGDLVDAKAKAALTALIEKLSAGSPAVVAENARPAAPPATAPAASVAASVSPTMNPPVIAVKGGVRHGELILTLAGISAGALLVFWWQVAREKKIASKPALEVQLPMPLSEAGTVVQASLAPDVAQAVREAVVQELAAQRRELLLAHQAATEEIAALVRRLDELQVPMQERLHTYETRIQTLEKELTLRTEENRELLKLKIATTRRQLEAELAANSSTTLAA